MIVDSKKELASALERIAQTVGISVDPDILDAYVAGQIDGLFFDPRYTSLPTIQKYLISAKTFLLQPDTRKRYDIRLASRTVPMVRILDQALETASRKVQNVEGRFKDLLLQTTIDEFESRVYEIVVAARYAMTAKIRDVGFHEERAGGMSPDIRCIVRRRPLLIECKRYNYKKMLSEVLNAAVRRLAEETFQEFHRRRISAVIELRFLVDPRTLDDGFLWPIIKDAWESRAVRITRDVSVSVKQLFYYKLPEFTLDQSPQYAWRRYGYSKTSGWQGMHSVLQASFGGPGWLDDISWECAAKWRIEDDPLIDKLQQLGFQRLFKGLEQLMSHGTDDAVLHVCFERDIALGHRQEELLRFIKTLATKGKHHFNWMIFNELWIDVDVDGYFDFREYSHSLSSYSSKGKEPPVQSVFTGPEEEKESNGAWGIGADLPTVKQERELKKRKKT